jgi:hypothetical protein
MVAHGHRQAEAIADLDLLSAYSRLDLLVAKAPRAAESSTGWPCLARRTGHEVACLDAGLRGHAELRIDSPTRARPGPASAAANRYRLW